MKSNESYSITQLYISEKNPYDWEATAELLIRKGSTHSVTAPRQCGKSVFCRHLITDALDKKHTNVLYFSPGKGSRSEALYYASICHKSIVKDDTFLETVKDGSLTIPENPEEMSYALSKKDILYSLIIIDDADIVQNEILHAAIIKALLNRSTLVFVGTEDIIDHQLNKSMWHWIQNHPSFIAINVSKKSRLLPDEDEAEDSLLGYIQNKFSFTKPRAAWGGVA